MVSCSLGTPWPEPARQLVSTMGEAMRFLPCMSASVFNISFGFICLLLKDLIGFCFLLGFLPVLCHDQMDGDSEEEQESPDTGEDEDGGDESDLVI